MSVAPEVPQIELTLRGNVGQYVGEYARDKITSAVAVAHRPVVGVHLVLDWRHDPAVERHAVAEVTVQVGGHAVRAKTAAPTMPEAVDELEERLRRQLARGKERDPARQHWTGVAPAHAWRHGDLPRRPVAYFPRPEETREVVRQKSIASVPMTVDEAAYEMDLLDHDFFLYRDVATDRPALVHHLPDNGYGLQGAGTEGTVAEVTTEPPPPSLSDAEARGRLEADGEPFVFYLDSETGEGRVIYHRYDGHYGLIQLTM